MIAYALAVAFACAIPAELLRWRLRRYAAANGRSIPKLNVTWANTVLPFADPRLNEALGAIRRYSLPAGFALCLTFAFVLSQMFDSILVIPAATSLSLPVFGASQYFCEACFAFGAEPAPVAEDAVDGIARTA